MEGTLLLPAQLTNDSTSQHVHVNLLKRLWSGDYKMYRSLLALCKYHFASFTFVACALKAYFRMSLSYFLVLICKVVEKEELKIELIGVIME